MPDRVWLSEKCEIALSLVQNILSNEPISILPDFDEHFFVQTDASSYGIGGALLQMRDDLLHPVCFVSRKLLPRERNYSTVEKECLAIVWSVGRLSRYLYGRHFTLQTDHRPLRHLHSSRSANGRLSRWALSLQPFSFNVAAIKGTTNVFGDFLSRNI